MTGKTYIERVIIKAIKNDIAIYAIHTNLDNVLNGVNNQLAKRLGLKNLRILSPRSNTLLKLSVYVPVDHVESVKNELFNAGAGNIGNYSHCSFTTEGKGSFRANEKAKPFVGNKNETHIENEARLEMILPQHSRTKVIAALLRSHPYEEVAYDIYALQNKWDQIGMGMIGELPKAMDEHEFLLKIKQILFCLNNCTTIYDITVQKTKLNAIINNVLPSMKGLICS